MTRGIRGPDGSNYQVRPDVQRGSKPGLLRRIFSAIARAFRSLFSCFGSRSEERAPLNPERVSSSPPNAAQASRIQEAASTKAGWVPVKMEPESKALQHLKDKLGDLGRSSSTTVQLPHKEVCTMEQLSPVKNRVNELRSDYNRLSREIESLPPDDRQQISIQIQTIAKNIEAQEKLIKEYEPAARENQLLIESGERSLWDPVAQALLDKKESVPLPQWKAFASQVIGNKEKAVRIELKKCIQEKVSTLPPRPSENEIRGIKVAKEELLQTQKGLIKFRSLRDQSQHELKAIQGEQTKTANQIQTFKQQQATQPKLNLDMAKEPLPGGISEDAAARFEGKLVQANAAIPLLEEHWKKAPEAVLQYKELTAPSEELVVSRKGRDPAAKARRLLQKDAALKSWIDQEGTLHKLLESPIEELQQIVQKTRNEELAAKSRLLGGEIREAISDFETQHLDRLRANQELSKLESRLEEIEQRLKGQQEIHQKNQSKVSQLEQSEKKAQQIIQGSKESQVQEEQWQRAFGPIRNFLVQLKEMEEGAFRKKVGLEPDPEGPSRFNNYIRSLGKDIRLSDFQ